MGDITEIKKIWGDEQTGKQIYNFFDGYKKYIILQDAPSKKDCFMCDSKRQRYNTSNFPWERMTVSPEKTHINSLVMPGCVDGVIKKYTAQEREDWYNRIKREGRLPNYENIPDMDSPRLLRDEVPASIDRKSNSLDPTIYLDSRDSWDAAKAFDCQKRAPRSKRRRYRQRYR